MAKFFPKLTQTHVFVGTDRDGGGFNCRMLPVSALAELGEIGEALKKIEGEADFEAVRGKLVELVGRVVPEEYMENVRRLGLPKLTDLAMYLMYGDPDDDDQPKKDEAKNG